LIDGLGAFTNGMKIAGRAIVRRSLMIPALLAGCSLLYDPGKLPSRTGELSDADVGGVLYDAPSSARDARGDDAAQPTPDAAQPTPDAAQPKPDASQPMPDASQPMPDASQPMPDAGHCGSTGELCCSGMTCDPSNECSGGTCHHCGSRFESCCDPGMTCDGILACVLGICTL
jgi:hypothetical protein